MQLVIVQSLLTYLLILIESEIAAFHLLCRDIVHE